MAIPEPAIDTTADPSSYDATVDDVLDLFDTQTRTIHASSTDHHATGFFVPVVVGDILHEPAYIDSDASRSSVPEDVLELLTTSRPSQNVHCPAAQLHRLVRSTRRIRSPVRVNRAPVHMGLRAVRPSF
uniref:Uncharacterized protein n=1 Tax=Spongospora subterranea TaxID=70186 RepID=A0A0H5RH23_9EUKA|eukprot:CRZ07989.1 hypothetical protein [Spongospora subterranea]